ncbi:carbon-nitrogen hydrolase family protein [Alphaproteobacteria bacterium GH1-50]|uniref:Carbon-nitrogen hydrolase family protein n=1 Tax=Kangsaoukella pontilimi TaxID=2691042 RepID=A0A7C9IID0_9RHOB|nr:carbon-nitrogen hydrolase family protein [Kangsaoukella pontilimi]MXQ08282.1 carbon-nitrogen hydrolase family protein [Kangsaoukella pontilimi]
MRAALVQLNASDDPAANLPVTLGFLEDAADAGAEIALTPEVTNCVSASRARQAEVLQDENEDITLAAVRELAARRGMRVLIGSLALKGGADGRFVNRSLLIGPDGGIAARYDKMHMFDVSISETETYRESAGYAPGDRAVLVQAGAAALGLTICYDLRFPYLFRRLAQAGAEVLTVPSAFAPDTGAAHWETLLRARAIETGSFVLAPAQCGTHRAVQGRERRTHGHSLAVDPWGRILADGGDLPGVTTVDLDVSAVKDVRGRVPSLTHDRDFEGP